MLCNKPTTIAMSSILMFQE